MQSNALATVLCCSIVLALLQRASEAKAIDGASDKDATEVKSEAEVGDKGGTRLGRVGDNVYGYYLSNDKEKLLHSETISKEWSWGATYEWIQFSDSRYRINRIEIKMNHKSTNNAATYVIYGGLEHQFADIEYDSKSFRGIYYSVRIYGYLH